MEKKSQKLLRKFKYLLWMFALFGILMTMNAIVFRSEILNQVCGISIVFTIAILIMTMVKTNSAWRLEEKQDVEKINEYLQTNFGGKVWCYKGEFSKEEIMENPFLCGHIVYPKLQIEGNLQEQRFKYRHVWVEERHRNVDDHTKNTKYVLFKGSQLQWEDKRMDGKHQLLLCTPVFSKRTAFRPEKEGYILLQKQKDGSSIYGLNQSNIAAEKFLENLYREIRREKENVESCILLRGSSIEVFVEEQELENKNIHEMMMYIANLIKY